MKGSTTRLASLFTSIITTFCVFFLFPLFIALVFSIRSFGRLNTDQSAERAIANLQRVADTVEAQISQIFVSVAALSQDNDVQGIADAIFHGSNAGNEYLLLQQLRSFADKYLHYLVDLHSVTFVSHQGARFSLKRDLILASESVLFIPGYQESVSSNNKVVFQGIEQNNKNLKNEEILTVSISVRDTRSLADLKVIVCAFYPSFLHKIIESTTREGGFFYILDEQGYIVIGERPPEIGEVSSKYLSDSRGRPTIVRIEGIGYLMLRTEDSFGWIYTQLLPYEKIVGSANQLIARMAISAILLLSIFVLAFWYAIRIHVQPLRDLVSHMRSVGEGNFDLSIEPSGSKETFELSLEFNRMVQMIKDLFNEVAHREKKIKEREIEVLQAQINPHFLLNTLNSIRIIAKLNNFAPIVTIMESVCGLLNGSLLGGVDHIPLRDELRLLEQYMEVMKFRYGDVFDYRLSVEPDAEPAYILRFLIQPLVENAITHGFGETGKRGTVDITVKRQNKNLCIRVADDGKGLSSMRSGGDLSSTYHRGIGLENIRERIRLRYGDEYGLAISDKPSGGVAVDFSVPFITGSDIEYV